ncbi:MAG: hypothetical protein J7M14_04645 [Planctomycetes bacterium]|nr:hypothetical protein [Planctomycetota bacterium]
MRIESRRTAMVLALACIAAASAGCSREVRVNLMSGHDRAHVLRIAVMEFDAFNSAGETRLGGSGIRHIPDAGKIVADAVAVALVGVPQLHVIDRKQTAQIMEHLGIVATDALSPANLARIAKATKADGILLGLVSDYHSWQIAMIGGSSVAFTARMVSAQTGEVLWSASCHRDCRQDHNKVLHDICAELAADLAEKLGK